MVKRSVEPSAPLPGLEEIPYDDTVRIGGVGFLITALVEKSGLSYRELMEKLGGDYSAWSRWANDERQIPAGMLARLAFAAKVDVDQVVAYAVLYAVQRHFPGVLQMKESREKLAQVFALVESRAA
jgi:transcriptional regulator with XRE-family HTH domain